MGTSPALPCSFQCIPEDQPMSSHMSSTSTSTEPKPARISHKEDFVSSCPLAFPKGHADVRLPSVQLRQAEPAATQRIWGCLSCVPHGSKLGTRARPLSQQERAMPEGKGIDVHLPVMSILWSERMAELVQAIKVIILLKIFHVKQ